jgi:hypothetical protein
MKIGFGVTTLVLLAASATLAEGPAGEWTVLFDGKSTAAWRGYLKDGFPEAGWTVEPDGSLHVHKGMKAGDLMTRKQWGDFELAFEWKVAEGANSGILYRFPKSRRPPTITR